MASDVEKEADPPVVGVEIVGTEFEQKIGAENANSTIKFVVRIKVGTSGHAWKIARSYQEFSDLHKKLKSSLSRKSHLPSLPKSMGKRVSDEETELKGKELQAYLVGLIGKPEVQNSTAWLSFLMSTVTEMQNAMRAIEEKEFLIQKLQMKTDQYNSTVIRIELLENIIENLLKENSELRQWKREHSDEDDRPRRSTIMTLSQPVSPRASRRGSALQNPGNGPSPQSSQALSIKRLSISLKTSGSTNSTTTPATTRYGGITTSNNNITPRASVSGISTPYYSSPPPTMTSSSLSSYSSSSAHSSPHHQRNLSNSGGGNKPAAPATPRIIPPLSNSRLSVVTPVSTGSGGYVPRSPRSKEDSPSTPNLNESQSSEVPHASLIAKMVALTPRGSRSPFSNFPASSINSSSSPVLTSSGMNGLSSPTSPLSPTISITSPNYLLHTSNNTSPISPIPPLSSSSLTSHSRSSSGSTNFHTTTTSVTTSIGEKNSTPPFMARSLHIPGFTNEGVVVEPTPDAPEAEEGEHSVSATEESDHEGEDSTASPTASPAKKSTLSTIDSRPQTPDREDSRRDSAMTPVSMGRQLSTESNPEDLLARVSSNESTGSSPLTTRGRLLSDEQGTSALYGKAQGLWS